MLGRGADPLFGAEVIDSRGGTINVPAVARKLLNCCQYLKQPLTHGDYDTLVELSRGGIVAPFLATAAKAVLPSVASMLVPAALKLVGNKIIGKSYDYDRSRGGSVGSVLDETMW